MINNTVIHHFYYSAKFSSFSKAASFLKTTQPSVSASIIALEKKMGTKLFERQSHGVRLTPAGSDIYLKAEAVIISLNEMNSALSQINRKSVVKIATQPRLYEKYLSAKLTPEFIEEFFIQINTGELATIKGWMDSGDVDLVITEGIFHNHPIFEHVDELDNLKFFWAKKRGIEFATPIPTFVHSDVWNHWHDLSECMYNNPNFRKVMVIDTPDFSCKLIERGMGIGLLPEQIILNNDMLEKCLGPTEGDIDGPIAIYVNQERKLELQQIGLIDRIISSSSE
ncbi:LysR family transcriptional regulator [Shewanella schlegeliana]|uniref:LysR family transcriptional regulator n=1 Tax=Shewanella schlegeliana TaxID=190308 RepID=A0ABS1T479_9GAMM|nr:LysR family transcriptional regulator [Shewanella schlegeliana]MBL4914959.1 LysR family transcriptional regulator [Shewanella schlegeliana]